MKICSSQTIMVLFAGKRAEVKAMDSAAYLCRSRPSPLTLRYDMTNCDDANDVTSVVAMNHVASANDDVTRTSPSSSSNGADDSAVNYYSDGGSCHGESVVTAAAYRGVRYELTEIRDAEGKFNVLRMPTPTHVESPRDTVTPSASVTPDSKPTTTTNSCINNNNDDSDTAQHLVHYQQLYAPTTGGVGRCDVNSGYPVGDDRPFGSEMKHVPSYSDVAPHQVENGCRYGTMIDGGSNIDTSRSVLNKEEADADQVKTSTSPAEMNDDDRNMTSLPMYNGLHGHHHNVDQLHGQHRLPSNEDVETFFTTLDKRHVYMTSSDAMAMVESSVPGESGDDHVNHYHLRQHHQPLHLDVLGGHGNGLHLLQRNDAKPFYMSAYADYQSPVPVGTSGLSPGSAAAVGTFHSLSSSPPSNGAGGYLASPSGRTVPYPASGGGNNDVAVVPSRSTALLSALCGYGSPRSRPRDLLTPSSAGGGSFTSLLPALPLPYEQPLPAPGARYADGVSSVIDGRIPTAVGMTSPYDGGDASSLMAMSPRYGLSSYTLQYAQSVPASVSDAGHMIDNVIGSSLVSDGNGRGEVTWNSSRTTALLDLFPASSSHGDYRGECACVCVSVCVCVSFMEREPLAMSRHVSQVTYMQLNEEPRRQMCNFAKEIVYSHACFPKLDIGHV